MKIEKISSSENDILEKILQWCLMGNSTNIHFYRSLLTFVNGDCIQVNPYIIQKNTLSSFIELPMHIFKKKIL